MQFPVGMKLWVAVYCLLVATLPPHLLLKFTCHVLWGMGSASLSTAGWGLTNVVALSSQGDRWPSPFLQLESHERDDDTKASGSGFIRGARPGKPKYRSYQHSLAFFFALLFLSGSLALGCWCLFVFVHFILEPPCHISTHGSWQLRVCSTVFLHSLARIHFCCLHQKALTEVRELNTFRNTWEMLHSFLLWTVLTRSGIQLKVGMDVESVEGAGQSAGHWGQLTTCWRRWLVPPNLQMVDSCRKTSSGFTLL